MRTLTIADNWKDWKFGDTDAVMTFTALDDDKVPDFSDRTLTFKIASTLNNDLEHPKDFAATATGYIQDKNVILKTEDVKQLTPGNYIVELWAMSNDTQKDAVYPSKGFAQFTIEENSMKVSDVTNIPSMTINAFWNAVMQKVGTLTKGAKGDPGKTPKIVIGSVTKLSPDAQPSATLVPLQSDPNTYTLNLQLPQGVQGEQGLQGIPGVGSKGLDGSNGLTPTIDPKTKHWMIGNTDTGVIAEGQAGKDADPSKYVTIVSFNQLRQQVQDNATASDANYAALKQKDARLDGRQTALTMALQNKLAQINVNPEFATDINELAAKYPNGKEGVFILNNGHTAIYQNGWQDSGHSITVGSFQFKAFVGVNEVTAPYDSLDTLPANSVVFYAPEVTDRFLASPTNEKKKAIIVITLGADASYTSNYAHIQEVIDRDSGIKYTRSSWYDYNGKGGWFSWHSNDFNKAIMRGTQNLMCGQDISNWTPHVQGTAVISDDPTVQFANTPIMHIESSKADQTSSFLSSPVLVDEKIISVQLPEMIVGQDYPNSHVYISIFPLATGESVGEQAVNQKAISFSLGNFSMRLGKFENIKLPDDTKKIVIKVTQQGIGHLFFGIPAVNYGPKCIAYSPSAVADEFDQVNERIDDNFNVIKTESHNLLYGQDIRNWTNEVKGEVDSDQSFNGTPIVHIKGTQAGQWNNWVSAPIKIDNTLVSLQLPQMSANEVYGQSNVYLSLFPMADGEKLGDDSVRKKAISYTLGNTQLSLSKFGNIKLPADTKRLVIRFTQYGVGDLYFGIPELNYGSSCISYNKVMLSQDVEQANATIPKLYIGALSSATGYDKQPVAFKLVQQSGVRNGYLLFDIQGDSSRSYPKKNFKIKLYKDAEGKNKLKVKMRSSWPETDKYNLKANWIDATHSRNIVNARLIKDAVSITPLEKPDQTKKILSTEGLGQIDGFPIELYFNDGYHGLYTLNTKKDETTFGMDSKDATNEVLSTELGKKDITDSTKAIIDGKNWSTEIHDVASDNVKSNLVKFLNFIEQSNDVDFHANLKNYIDVSSVINLILFGWLSQEYDFYSKSELFATWNDGGYWYLIPYDLDSTWGLLWDGSDVVPNRDDFNLSEIFSDPQTAWAASANDNKFQQRVIKLFKPEIKKQGQLLRSTVWSTPNIIAKFKSFIDEVPALAYQKDQEKWSNIPSKDKTNFEQIQSAVIQRGQEFDDFLNKI